MKNKIISILIAAAVAVFSAACSDGGETVSKNTPVSETVQPTVALDSEALVEAGLFSNRDFDTGYDAETAVKIELGSGIICDDPAVKVDSGIATISAEGTYILSGSTTAGMVIVDAANTDKVQLVLDNVSINSQSSAAIYVKQADKVFITLAEGSVNELSNGGSFEAIDENSIDGVVFAKDDLNINGKGSLSISSPAGHGIVCKDSLSITGGVFEISCASNGLKAKDDICIADGEFTISSGKDAIQADHDENEEKGFVYIADGSYIISAEGDGISSSAYMQIDGGSFELLTGGGNENAAERSSDMWGQFMPGGMRGRGGMGHGNMAPGGAAPERPDGEMPEMGDRPDMPQGGMNMGGRPDMHQGGFEAERPGTVENQTANTSGDGSSMKGLKAKGELSINGGSFVIDSADDALHSNTSMTINAGSFDIAAGDDALHADENLIVNGGKINISTSYEGMEALHLSIFGGDIVMTASDDGLNAAGGTDSSGFGGRDAMFGGGMNMNSDGSIVIAGGNISITAYGDGLDANGSIEMTGGDVTVCGPTYGDTAVIDYNTTAVISGGSFIGSGSAMMAQNFSDCSQGVVWAGFGSTHRAGTEVYVTDSDGNSLMSFAPELDFELVIVSSPELSTDETYSLSIST